MPRPILVPSEGCPCPDTFYVPRTSILSVCFEGGIGSLEQLVDTERGVLRSTIAPTTETVILWALTKSRNL